MANLSIPPGPSFTAAMALAVHQGRKTQTRRVIPERVLRDTPAAYTREDVIARFAPYQPGRTYYLREPIRRGGPIPGGYDENGKWDDNRLFYAVEYVADGAEHPDATWVWKPASLPGRYMPRGLARLNLEIESVRVERVQDITAGDALAEGFEPTPDDDRLDAVCLFADGWDTINGKTAPWESNPWCWVFTFRGVPRG